MIPYIVVMRSYFTDMRAYLAETSATRFAEHRTSDRRKNPQVFTERWTCGFWE